MRNTPNPFRQRGAIRDKAYFVGRRSELAQIIPQLKAIQSISLVGERRIGKSSLLYRLVQLGPMADGTDFQVIYSDLPNVTDERSFYERICREIGVAGDDFDHLERGLRGRKVIACLDEFERVASRHEFSGDFYGALRSLAQSGNFALVVATQHSLADLCKGRQIATSPFWNIFFRIDLGLFTREEAEEFIESRFSDQHVRITSDEVFRLIEIAGQFPFFLQLACYHLFEMKVSRSDQWELAFQQEAGDHLDYLWECLGKSERQALRYILGFGGAPPTEYLLNSLASRGLITLDPTGIDSARVFSGAFEQIVANPPKDKRTMNRWKRLVSWCKGGKVSVGTSGASGEIQFERPTDKAE